MPPPCAIETCKRKSRALCHCCNKNLCPDHLKEHDDAPNSQLNTFVDEINTLGEQLLALTVDELISNGYQKLDKWRDNCHMTINDFYQQKCEECKQRCHEKVDKQRKEIEQIRAKVNELIREQEATYEDIPSLKATINDIRRDIEQFGDKGIIVEALPLTIDNKLIYIEEWSSNELDISNLPNPYRKIDCSNDGRPALACNNRFLLLDQYPNLLMFDTELNIVKQSPWQYSFNRDMCWSSTLNCFIIITNEDGVFLINEDLTSIEDIKMIEKKEWSSCTCSDVSLFLTPNRFGTNIFQFNLLPSFQLIKQWKSPETCHNNEFIHNIAYNSGTLALIISHKTKETVHIELRSTATLERLWSLPLDTKYTDGRVLRVCLLKGDEWLVVDYKTSHLLHISKDGKIKSRLAYKPTPHNAVLFGSNKFVIRTENCLDFYRV